eukprot:TRINITY_DN15389_c0_g1_i1.p1 TRINITY_DN15389_c0_g1~~TRINITY_DN15389_c0_g1_i1.p1  ORF type:complete len:336 (+),score=87.86 TRINITY_DN15389_c0_g1_i1:86-1093(+)
MASWATAILSSVLAGGVAITSTVAIEKLGGNVVGVIASSPTTIVPASIGIAILSPERLGEAMFSIPAVMVMNALFLYLWRVIPPFLPSGWKFSRKLGSMIGISLGIWFSIALTYLVIMRYGFNSNYTAIQVVAGLAMASQLTFGLIAVFKQKRSAPKGKNKVGLGTLFSRGLLAAVAVFLAVLISKTNGLAAGLATAFPAIFTTTMISLWISQGENVTSGAVGPMMLGSLSVPVYSVAMSQLAPALGAFIGALVSYIISIVTCSIPIVFVLKKIESRYTQLGPEEDKKCEAVNGHQVELAVTAEPELSNGVEHVTSDDVAVVPLEEEIGDTVHKD